MIPIVLPLPGQGDNNEGDPFLIQRVLSDKGYGLNSFISPPISSPYFSSPRLTKVVHLYPS